MQVVDGVLTDDNDAFLYGAKAIYCELSANEKVFAQNLIFSREIYYHLCCSFVLCHHIMLPSGTFNVCVFNEHNSTTDRFGLCLSALEKVHIVSSMIIGLGRVDLVALGLLLGSDYCPGGVPGVGKKLALQVVREWKRKKSTSLLERFRDWRSSQFEEGMAALHDDIV